VIFVTVYDLAIWVFRLFLRREKYLQERLNVIDYELRMKYPSGDTCKNHVDEEEQKVIRRGKKARLITETSTHHVLVMSVDGRNMTREELIFKDGRKIYKEPRLYMIAENFIDKNRTLFDFFNEEYLEADGHFILRIIGANAR
jgi:hypothetical protein